MQAMDKATNVTKIDNCGIYTVLDKATKVVILRYCVVYKL